MRELNIRVTDNTRKIYDVSIGQFETVDEALLNVPHDRLLNWINFCYKNQQVSGFWKTVK